jgi:regulator of replication initiation timing
MDEEISQFRSSHQDRVRQLVDELVKMTTSLEEMNDDISQLESEEQKLRRQLKKVPQSSVAKQAEAQQTQSPTSTGAPQPQGLRRSLLANIFTGLLEFDEDHSKRR